MGVLKEVKYIYDYYQGDGTMYNNERLDGDQKSQK